MDIPKGHHAAHAHNTKHVGAHSWRERGADFVLVEEIHPPPRIELARERMLLCRLYLGLIRSINEDYGASFAGQNDSSTFRTIGMTVNAFKVCSRAGGARDARYVKDRSG